MSEVKLGEYQVCKALKKSGEPCGHRWLPRGTYVFRCPKCMSFRWNEEPEKVKS